MKPIIFDDTALVALFEGQRRVYATWIRAKEMGYPLLVPAAAVLAQTGSYARRRRRGISSR